MIAVFISFVTSTNVVIKQLSVGLAASILIDATVVRLLLVPAVMDLLGTASWWLPKWLSRILPRIDMEGTPEPSAAPSADTAPASSAPAAAGRR
jgi:RND superfamily putative drug exporter